MLYEKINTYKEKNKYMKNAPQERNIFIIAQNACTVNYPSYKKRGTSVPLKRIMNIVKKHENENEEKPSLTVYIHHSARIVMSSMAHKKRLANGKTLKI